MGRTLLAGLVAGVVVFLWGAVAHMLLPLGMIGMKVPADAAQQTALTTVQQQFGDAGVYMLPMPQESQWKDSAAMTAFGERAAQMPYAFVVFQPQGRNGMNMGPMLGMQAATVIGGGVLAAFIAAGVAGSRATRILVVTAMGVFAWLVALVPYWNWYRFPGDFTLAALAEHGIGWLLGGIAIALVLRPRPG
jgi:hypothetical protein